MGNLTSCTNYRGLGFTQIAAKVYNRMILNIIRPVIHSLLCPTQNGFRPSRSTSSHVLGLCIIAVEVRNHKNVALIIFIDFKRHLILSTEKRMLKIFLAYGIPPEIGNAISAMYENTSALVMTTEGNTDVFPINTGNLQGDPLAPFLFVICLGYVLRSAIGPSAALSLKKKG